MECHLKNCSLHSAVLELSAVTKGNCMRESLFMSYDHSKIISFSPGVLQVYIDVCCYRYTEL